MNKKIAVIGSTNVDFVIKSGKLPVLGETVTNGQFAQNFGGKGANQAVGAARAGGDITFVSCLGQDLYADELLKSFRKDYIVSDFVFREKGVATGCALIMIDSDGNNYISVAPGANFRMTPAYIDKALDAIRQAELVLIQMEIPADTTACIIKAAAELRKRIIFNLAPARPFDVTLLQLVNTFIVNEIEASMVTGMKVETVDEVRTAAADLLDNGPENVIITLGSNGSYLATRDGVGEFIPAFKVNPVDTTAAGDVYCGALAVALMEGRTLNDAVRFASAASAISVTRLGAQPSAPYRTEIDAFLEQHS